MKQIIIVTHGDKEAGANPKMTKNGFAQIEALRTLLPAEPSYVACGTGRRHLDVAMALNLLPGRYSSIFGDGDSMEVIEEKKFIILPDGTQMNPQSYTTLKDLGPVTKTVIAQLQDGTVVCAGRPLMIMLDFPQAKSGAVYKITIEDGYIINITEVVALGAIDPCLAK